MKSKFNFKVKLLCAILGLLLLVPTFAQAKEKMESQLKEMKVQILKHMKLAPGQRKGVYGGGR